MTIGDDYRDEVQLAEFLRITLRTVRRYRERRCGPPFIKIGRKIYYSRSGTADWIERLEKNARRSQRDVSWKDPLKECSVDHPSWYSTHVPTAAIAAAVRETWETLTFPPSIHEFITIVRKQRAALYMTAAYLRDFGELCLLTHEVCQARGGKLEDD